MPPDSPTPLWSGRIEGGMAPEMVNRVIEIITFISQEDRSIIIISHNLDLIMMICDRVIVLDGGRKISEGIPKEVREDPVVIDTFIN